MELSCIELSVLSFGTFQVLCVRRQRRMERMMLLGSSWSENTDCGSYMAVSVSKFLVSTRNWFFFAIYVGLVLNWYLEFVIF